MMQSEPPCRAPAAHLLVVDDDPGIRNLLFRYFGDKGFRVSLAADAVEARAAVERERIDAILLDLGLPGEDGLALTRHLRSRWQGAIIILSGHGETVERVVGLELGADDYLAKPFDLRELLARVRSVLRRVPPSPASTPEAGDGYAFADFRLDPQARRLSRSDGEEIELSTGEFDLLKVLVENAQRVLSRDQLMQRTHGREAGPFDRAVDIQIVRLRRKIESDPANPSLIKSVRGVGYLLAAKVRRA